MEGSQNGNLDRLVGPSRFETCGTKVKRIINGNVVIRNGRFTSRIPFNYTKRNDFNGLKPTARKTKRH